LNLAGLGVIVGIAVALPVTRLLRGLLFDVTAADPVDCVQPINVERSSPSMPTRTWV
jgi:hypothetical protein